VPFLRLSRDRRGYENTYLLHTARHGAHPRVLYWYRTAPGVRVGRPALDEDAIRTIEEQHPDVDFNWSEILAVGAAISVEVEAPAPPRRRSSGKPPRDRDRERERDRDRDRGREPGAAVPAAALEPGPEAIAAGGAELEPVPEPLDDAAPAAEHFAATVRPRGHDLLEELVGREIATRLHARYAELSARISEVAAGDEPTREKWQVRADPLNPDLWVTPDEILAGVQRADALFDQLRRDLLANG